MLKGIPSILSPELLKILIIGFIDRFQFYERAHKAYAVVATGERALYACLILKKGVIR